MNAAKRIIKTLTYCGICGGKMQPGEPFQWYEKSGFRGGSRSGGRNARFLPAHTEPKTCMHNMCSETPAVFKQAGTK